MSAFAGDDRGPQPIVLFEIAKGWLTGSEPDIGEMHEIKKG